MKRMFAFIALIACIFVFSLFGNFDLLGHEKIYKVCIVTNSQIANADCEDVIKSGNQFYYTGSKDEIKNIYRNLHKVDGIILYFQNSNVKELIDFYKIESYQSGDVDNLSMYYGYSPYYKDYNIINNKKINVQIAIGVQEIIVGFPAILTGF